MKNLKAVFLIFSLVLSFVYFSKNLYEQKKSAEKREYSIEDCYGCHNKIEKLHSKGKHSKIYCENCHNNLKEHLSDPSEETESNMKAF